MTSTNAERNVGRREEYPEMNVLLWILQIALALMIGMAGVVKVITPRVQLTEKMSFTQHATDGQVKALGAVEVLGALGLILPAATGILPWLTPLAAVGIAVIMAGAIVTHVVAREFPNAVVNLVLLAVSLFVAVERFGSYRF
ncbi:DoxX family protein [Nocardia asteroides]|nr:DoxX family protein [Nocardia asteroides]UGT47311.1 DoxX family protein [Nocardia asteroides]